MNRKYIVCGIFAAAAAFFAVPRHNPLAAGHGLPNTGLADPATLSHLYNQWRAANTGNTLDLALLHIDGLSSEPASAGGSVRVDLTTGAVTSRITGLPEGNWELLLVDNAPNTSALPENTDRTINAGPYRRTQEGLSLEGSIARDRLSALEIDRAVVVRAGQNAPAFVLIGGSNLYNRLARGYVTVDNRRIEEEAVLWNLVAKGRTIFLRERFQGNGRTCSTCHVESNNFTLDPAFIATLPPTDPLFVHERNTALKNLEDQALLRKLALILGNPDGMEDPAKKYVLRPPPPLQALGVQSTAPDPSFGIDFTSGPVDPPERLGWGNDALPLRDFAIGAIIQHLPKTMNRLAGVDYRIPSEEELDALAAYQLSIGRREDFDLVKLRLRTEVGARGQRLYTDTGMIGEPGHKNCNACHFNAGGTAAYALNPGVPGFAPKLDALPRGFNATVGTNVNELAASLGLKIPRDGGFGSIPLPMGSFGNFGFVPDLGRFPVEEFNSMSVVESADTAPYFHNHAVATLEESVAFYGSKAYQGFGSIGDVVGGPIPVKISDNPNDPEVQSIASFLRVLNTLENIRSAISAATRARLSSSLADGKEIAALGREEVLDAILVLNEGSLLKNPDLAVIITRSRLSLARAALDDARNGADEQALVLALQRGLDWLRLARESLADPSTLPESYRN